MLCEQEILRKLHGSPSGCCATFVALDENKGIKLWNKNECYEEVSDECYETQKALAEYGLAPQVYEKVELNDWVGYVTERITPIWQYDNILSCDTNMEIFDDLCSDYQGMIEEWNYKAEMATGWYCSDGHAGNFGYSKSGIFMCLDFGNE